MAVPITNARPRIALLSCAALLLSAAPCAPAAADETIDKLRAADRKNFSDREIVAGFIKLTFGAEFPVMGRVDRIRKYDGPIRVHVENRAKPDRGEQIAAVMADIKNRIRNLDLAVAENRRGANMHVTLIHDRDLPRTIRTLQGRRQSRDVQRLLQVRCLSEIRRDKDFRIVRSDAIVVADAGDLSFYDCAYEQLLRGLGPINDDPTLPWTMFNLEVRKGFFSVYDQYLLNILYDGRIRPGMTETQVRAVLPQVLPAVRSWVAKVNKIPK